MDPDPKIILSDFVFWTTSPSDILPPTADLKISFGHNGESFDVSSPLKRCDDVWTDLGLGLMVPASGILVVDVLQARYPVPDLENSDRTYSKLGFVYIDLGGPLDMSDNISNPEMRTTSGAVRYATTLVMEAGHLPILHCSMAVTRFSCFPVAESLSPLYLLVQICAEKTSDADFKRYAEELEGFLGASNGHIFLTMTLKQVRNVASRCLSMQNYHEKIHVLALFAGVLNDQFLLRSRIQTHLDPHDSEEFMSSRILYHVYGNLASILEGSHRTVLSDGLLDLPDTNPTKTLRLQSLGKALIKRYCDGDDEDQNALTQGIFFLETVARLRIDAYASDFDQYELYQGMLRAYFRRYQRSNDVVDIDKALLYGNEARKLGRPRGKDPEEMLLAMAAAFAARHTRSRDLGDLHKAKELVYEALALSCRDSPSYVGILRRSADVLYQCCQIDNTALNCEPVILRHEELLSLLPRGDPAGVQITMHLMRLYDDAGNPDHAIKIGRDFVDANPNRPDIDIFLVRLGEQLFRRLVRPRVGLPLQPSPVLSLEELHDLDEAITLLSRIPLETHQIRSHGDTFISLALALYFRYYLYGRKDLSDLCACLSIVSCIATSPLTPLAYRLCAADMWAAYAHGRHPTSGMVAYRTLMSLIPGLLWMGIGLQDRHEMLARGAISGGQLPHMRQGENQFLSIGQVPNRSAAFAIGQGEYCTAIEWLEQGRSIIWDQMLQLRVSLERLQLVDKQLAERLRVTGRELAISTARSGSWATRMNDAEKEEEGQRHRRLTQDWENGITEVGRLPGFEDFLASKDFAYLSRAANDCTAIIINTHYLGVDALVLFPPDSDGHNTDILHVPLATQYSSDLDVMRQRILALIQPYSPARKLKWRPNSTTVYPAFYAGDKEEFVFNSLEVILSGLWYEIVLPILVHCNQARPDLFSGSPGVARPRVRWCPTGPLSFLPLHAAGDYSTSHVGHKVYDFVISSYIPTLNSIIRDNPTSSSTYVDGSDPRILAVSCATPKGYPPIIGTQAELGQIKKHAGLAGCKLTAVTEQDATADRILEEIKGAHWVHFACHGVQDAKVPTQSALILQNGTRVTLSDFVALDLPHAELAYLSACETATGYDAVPSESIHLAAGMLLAGFRSVIATMWTIKDRHAPNVADSVYGYLLRGGQGSAPDYKESAVALDLAVQRLRDEVGETDFISWVPYIHIGA